MINVQIVINFILLAQVVLCQWQLYKLRKDVIQTFGLADKQLDEIRARR